MAIEKTWEAIPPRQFAANGTKGGEIPLVDARGIRVGMKVMLQSVALPTPKEFKVKRVRGNSVFVGPTDKSIEQRSDVSGYLLADVSFLFVNEQQKSNVPKDDQDQASWEHEPVNARRVHVVDDHGNTIDTVRDSNGLNRLAVDGQFTADVDVQVDVDISGVYDETENPDPDNIGLIAHTRSVGTDETKQVERVTAKRGTTDTDTVSQDVSVHDHNGNKFDVRNPLPTTGSFEKFFTLVAASKWMELANYDEVVPTYSAGGTVLTLAYKEDGVTIGEAVVTFTSLEDWSMKLNRWINDDDGTQLLDDDDQPLNLE